MNLAKKLNSLLVYVAIGTVADCQSIIEPTNRLLVKAGLQLLNAKKYHSDGLEQLAIQTNLKEKQTQGYKVQSSDLGFLFSPILNSSGRISHARLSIELLVTNSQEKANKLANELIQTNNSRKEMVKEILEEVNLQAETQFLSKQSALWLEGNWNKGLVGLIASRLVSNYSLPVVVVSRAENESTASLRAPEGYHLPNAISTLDKGLILKGGGHPGAAGFTAISRNLIKIKEGLILNLQNQVKNTQTQATSYLPPDFSQKLPIQIDSLRYRKDLIWLNEDELNSQLLSDASSIDPFGMDFLQPKFVIKLSSFGYKIMGKDFSSARILASNFNFSSFNLDQDTLETLTSLEPQINPKNKDIWAILKTSQNTWNNKTTIELIAEKIWLVDQN